MNRHWNRLVAFLLLILAIPACFAQADRLETARRYMVRGAAAMDMAKSKEDLNEAAAEFRKATEAAPEMADAWYNLGLVQSKLDLYSEAAASFQRYLNLNPKGPEAQKVRDEIIKLQYRQERHDKKFSVGWSKVGASDKAVMYLDKSTIRKGDSTVTVQYLLDQVTAPAGGWNYLSQKGLYEVDCVGGRLRLVRFEAFSDHMGNGTVNYSSEKFAKEGGWNPKWDNIAPDSLFATVSDAVCK